MGISDWSSDVCSSDLVDETGIAPVVGQLVDVEGLAGLALHARTLEELRAQLGEPFGRHVGHGIWPVAHVTARLPRLAHRARGHISSEERRVGKEGVSTRKSWWSPYH